MARARKARSFSRSCSSRCVAWGRCRCRRHSHCRRPRLPPRSRRHCRRRRRRRRCHRPPSAVAIAATVAVAVSAVSVARRPSASQATPPPPGPLHALLGHGGLPLPGPRLAQDRPRHHGAVGAVQHGVPEEGRGAAVARDGRRPRRLAGGAGGRRAGARVLHDARRVPPRPFGRGATRGPHRRRRQAAAGRLRLRGLPRDVARPHAGRGRRDDHPDVVRVGVALFCRSSRSTHVALLLPSRHAQGPHVGPGRRLHRCRARARRCRPAAGARVGGDGRGRRCAVCAHGQEALVDPQADVCPERRARAVPRQHRRAARGGHEQQEDAAAGEPAPGPAAAGVVRPRRRRSQPHRPQGDAVGAAPAAV